MAAILRVKRKKDDEPLDALIISCKRQKVESDDAGETSSAVTAIVKFAGTIEKPDDCVVEHITKTLTKEVLKSNFKQHIVDVTKKAREKTKQESNENRYKIVSNMRSLDTSMIDHIDEDVVNVIDIEDTKAVPDDKTDTAYVYDLYYTQTEEAIRIDDLVSVLPVEEDLVFEDYYKDNEDGYRVDSEDSNSESNWKNDYPDSEYSDESDDSVGHSDMRKAMKNLNVEDDLSSDEEDFAYGLDAEDVERYGYQYAKFKARKRQEEGYDSSISNELDASQDDEEHDSDDVDQMDNDDND